MRTQLYFSILISTLWAVGCTPSEFSASGLSHVLVDQITQDTNTECFLLTKLDSSGGPRIHYNPHNLDKLASGLIRFAWAHELGHIQLLHWRALKDYDQLDSESRLKVEDEADSFAVSRLYSDHRAIRATILNIQGRLLSEDTVDKYHRSPQARLNSIRRWIGQYDTAR